MITPDSSGLRGLPNRTPLWSDGSLPPRPTSYSDMLNCPAPTYPRTIPLYAITIQNYTELQFLSPHGALPAQINHTITCTPEYIYLTIMNNISLSTKYKTHPSSSRTYTQLPDCLLSPLEAATSKGGNHSWQRTRQPSQPRTTVYKLFRVQYLPHCPQPISEVYNPRCAIATHTVI